MNGDCQKLLADITEAYTGLDFERLPELDNRIIGMSGLRKEILSCRRCRFGDERVRPVTDSGDLNPGMMIICGIPDTDDDITGRPLTGEFSATFERIISNMQRSGIPMPQRDALYITNIIKCRPNNPQDATDEEVRVCLPFLLRQIEIVIPEVILVMGNVAARGLLSTDKWINGLRGRFHDFKGIPVMPTYSLSYLDKNPGQKMDTWNDIIKAVDLIKKIDN